MTPPTLGTRVANWIPPTAPKPMILNGKYCRLEPLNAEKHAALLFNAFAEQDYLYDYLPAGPFHSAAQYHRWVKEVTSDQANLFFVVHDLRQNAYLGVLSYLRIAPVAGSIEVGNINFSHAMQRSPVSTEAVYLLMKWAFEVGYRRFEWKCNALNRPSRRAAQLARWPGAKAGRRPPSGCARPAASRPRPGRRSRLHTHSTQRRSLVSQPGRAASDATRAN